MTALTCALLAAQMIQFPINNYDNFPWSGVVSMESLANLLDILSMNHLASRISSKFSITMFYLCLIWIAGIVSAAIWCANAVIAGAAVVAVTIRFAVAIRANRCGYSFSQRSFRVLWPLKFLRFGAQVTTTVLFIPITHVLLGIFHCPHDVWESTGWKCWQSTHMAFAVLVLSVLPLFIGLSLIVVATFFDRDPSSKSIESKVPPR